MQKETVINIVNQQKSISRKAIAAHRYGDALAAVSCAAGLVYDAELYYRDDDLESMLQDISTQIISPRKCDSDVVLFYDGFGFDLRGLALIYLRALCAEHHVIYVTYEKRRDMIPTIRGLLESSGGTLLSISYGNLLRSVHELDEIVQQYRPRHFFFYSEPKDVIATTVMYAYEGCMNRYQINLTDHAFWMGAGCIDKCIEFRDYGAAISDEYRHIPRSQLIKIPYYPVINYNRPFDGYPFSVERDQKVIFSGGWLYKTLGADNQYYKIVDHILSTYQDTIFWYAGTGDTTQIDLLIAKYPGRCYLTEERSDLYQVLEHCYLYLSTYPLCGGLMFQYAAAAGKVPLTLRNGDITDDFLIDQDQLHIQFDNIDDFYEELDHLMRDAAYCAAQNEKLRRSVITPEAFRDEVNCLLVGEPGNYPIHYRHIDTNEFQEWHLANVTEKSIYGIISGRRHMPLIKYEPVLFIKGIWGKIFR